MKTVFQEIIAYEGDYRDYIEKLRLMDIFGPVIDRFDPPTAKAIIRYIAYVYSKESDLMHLKEGLPRQKKRCAHAAGLPEELYGQVAEFIPQREDDDVPAIIRNVAIKYLAYQNEANNRDLKSLYDLYDEMLYQSAKVPLRDEDFKMKFECRKMANEIRGWINDLEKKIKEEDAQTKAARQELKERTRHNTAAIRPENAARVNARI